MKVNHGNSLTVLGMTRVAAQKSNDSARPPSKRSPGISSTAIPASPAVCCANTTSCSATCRLPASSTSATAATPTATAPAHRRPRRVQKPAAAPKIAATAAANAPDTARLYAVAGRMPSVLASAAVGTWPR